MINIGNMKHKVTFLVMGELENEYGERFEGIVSEFTRFAEIIDSESRKDLNADGRDVEDSKTFRLRYSPSINTDVNLRYNGLVYEIPRIENPKNANKELIVEAISYVSN